MYWPFLLALFMALYAVTTLTNITVVFMPVIMGIIAALIAITILFNWRSHVPPAPPAPPG